MTTKTTKTAGTKTYRIIATIISGARVKAGREPKVWQVRIPESENIYCTCPAYSYCKADWRTCKHIKHIKQVGLENAAAEYAGTSVWTTYPENA